MLLRSLVGSKTRKKLKPSWKSTTGFSQSPDSALKPRFSQEGSAHPAETLAHLPSALAPGLSPPLGCGSRPSRQLSGEEERVSVLQGEKCSIRSVATAMDQEGYGLQGRGRTQGRQQRPQCRADTGREHGTCQTLGQHCHLMEISRYRFRVLRGANADF